MREIILTAVGLLFWAVTQFIALMMGAGGHGWNAPLWLSMFLVPLYPLAFVEAFAPATGGKWLVRGLLIAAGLLDLLLLASLFTEGEYIARLWNVPENPAVLLLWGGLWAGWQLLAFVALARNHLTRAG